MADWTDQFVGDRMAVDQQFADRVRDSGFNQQEWSTIMTAVDFEIEQATLPEEASLVARTDRIRDVMPAVEELNEQALPMGGQSSQSSAAGIVDRIAEAFGIGGTDEEDGIDEQRLERAQGLAQEYAAAFESHLKEEGKWERACTVAAETTSQ